MRQARKNGEPPYRLRSRCSVPSVQAILDGMPKGFLEMVPEAQRVEFISELECADTVKEAIRVIVAIAQHKELAHKLLVDLDRNAYDNRWNCKKCGYRYGRHDKDTGTCPKIDVVGQEMLR